MPEIQLPTKAKQDDTNTKVTDVQTKTNTINSNLGAPTSTASSSTSANAHAKLNFLLNRPSVKNIQSGIFTVSASQELVVIDISAVSDRAKCSLSVFGGIGRKSDGTITSPYIHFNSNAQLYIVYYSTPGAAARGSWELIEYY